MSHSSLRVSRKELSADEVLDRLDDGTRVVVTVELAGVSLDVALRRTDDQYVCDTGMKLMTYDDREAMRRCIERLRLTA